MKRKPKMTTPLDTEEQELLNSLERGEWKSVDNIEQEMKKAKLAADNTMKKLLKKERINLRIAKQDLDGIKLKAYEEGIPYQTMIASVIHKYTTGRLVEG